MFLLPPVSPRLEEMARAGIDAATAAGIRHVVGVSAADAAASSPTPWAAAHARADDYLRLGAFASTTLRAACFMSNLLPMAAAIRRGVLAGTSSDGATCWVAPGDVAAAAAAVLGRQASKPEATATTSDFLLTGTEALTFTEVAALLSQALGRRVRYVDLPAPFFQLATRASGNSAWLAKGLRTQFADVVRHRRDGVDVDSDDLSQLLGGAPTTIGEYARDHLA